jgi:hypothetical protein
MLTPAMSCTIAAKPLQVDSARHPATVNSVRIIASLVRSFKYSEALAAKLEHFWHEWKSFQLSFDIQGLQDLVLCSNLDPVTRLQS